MRAALRADYPEETSLSQPSSDDLGSAVVNCQFEKPTSANVQRKPPVLGFVYKNVQQDSSSERETGRNAWFSNGLVSEYIAKVEMRSPEPNSVHL